jgi:hypothetical protein
MTTEVWTLYDEARPQALPLRSVGDSVLIARDALRRALGWELKPEGLCKGDLCVPVRNPAELAGQDGIDLAAFARALGRPLALDTAERVAVLGAAAADRSQHLRSLEAPDFTLPDLAGRLHSLSHFKRNKVLLVAWASW